MNGLLDANNSNIVPDKHEERIPIFVYFVAAFSAVGGLLFGYDTGIVSGAMILMRDYFYINHTMQGVVVSVTIITAWLFCLLAGQLSDRYGRKVVIILASVVFSVGSIMLGLAPNIALLIAGRAVVGIGIGLASMCVPLYIAEVAPQNSRGLLVTINNCAITSGQMVASLVAGVFSKDHLNGWRYMLGIAAIPAVIQFVGFFFMPESPRWLIMKGRYDEAKIVLRKVREPNANVEVEFETIKARYLEVMKNHANDKSSILRKILKNPALRTALIVGSSLQMIQQLAGINTVMYYSATIIEMSGVKNKSDIIWLSAATAGMNCFCSFIGLLFVERVGRRKLTLASLFGVILSLTILAISFRLTEVYTPELTYFEPMISGSVCNTFSTCSGCVDSSQCGYCFIDLRNGTYEGACLQSQSNQESSISGLCNSTELSPYITWAYEWCPSPYTWVTFTGLLLYLFFFAPGMGSTPWTINSEIYPLWARGTCYSIATSVNWFFNFVISLTFLMLMHAMTKYGAFFLYASLAALGFVFLFVMLPETKGVSLEDVEMLFSHFWWKEIPTKITIKEIKKSVEFQTTVSYTPPKNSDNSNVLISKTSI